MTTAPFVELGFNPTDLRPQDLPKAGAFLGSPAHALEAALAVARAAMVDQMRKEIRGIAQPTQAQLLRIADLAWQAVFPRYRKISAPVMADAYIRAYRKVDAGDVPTSVVYDLADKHAEKVGDYFHTTSREALAEGFNSLVNRRLPAKAAADRVLDAYGLTPRQMRTYVGAKQFDTPVSDVMPRSIKAKARAYIDKVFTTRTKKLSDQEEHNIDQQAQQFAWMWLQDKGRLPQTAEKMWITARDERVCPVCGPLHGQKVRVEERFVSSQGEFWTPGLHPNCRCVVRLLEHRFGKAADWDPDEHPRGGDPENRGRFSRVGVQEREVIRTNVIEPTEEPVVEEVTKPRPLGDAARPLGDRAPRSTNRSALGAQTKPLGDALAPLGSEEAVTRPLGAAPVARALGDQGTINRQPLGARTRQALLGTDSVPQAQRAGRADLAPFSKTVPLHVDRRSFYGVHSGSGLRDTDFYLDQQDFVDSMDEAKQLVAQARRDKVEEEYDWVVGGRDSLKVVGVTHDDVRVTGHISVADFKVALNYVAQKAQGEYDWEEIRTSSPSIPVIWTDGRGQIRDDADDIEYDDAVIQQAIRPEDFVFQILKVEDAHRDENLTRWRSANRFRLSGDYEVYTVGDSVPDDDGKLTQVTPIKPIV